MRDHRFGRKIKLPSTAAIKHELLMMMFEDEIRAVHRVGCSRRTNLQRSRCCNGSEAHPPRARALKSGDCAEQSVRSDWELEYMPERHICGRPRRHNGFAREGGPGRAHRLLA